MASASFALAHLSAAGVTKIQPGDSGKCYKPRLCSSNELGLCVVGFGKLRHAGSLIFGNYEIALFFFYGSGEVERTSVMVQRLDSSCEVFGLQPVGPRGTLGVRRRWRA